MMLLGLYLRSKDKEKIESSMSNGSEDHKEEESKEPDYEESEEKQEEQTGEIATNHVF